MARAAAPGGTDLQVQGSWPRAPAPLPPPPLRSPESLLSPSARLTQPWGPPEAGKGTGLALHCPGPRGGRRIRPWEASRASRRCPWHGGRAAEAGSLRISMLFPRRPHARPLPLDSPTVPGRLGRRRTPWAQGSGPGAPADLTLGWHLRDDREAAGVPGGARLCLSASQMNPPKSFPKLAATEAKQAITSRYLLK